MVDVQTRQREEDRLLLSKIAGENARTAEKIKAERENKLKALPLSRKQQKPFTEKLEKLKNDREKRETKNRGKSENKHKSCVNFLISLTRMGPGRLYTAPI